MRRLLLSSLLALAACGGNWSNRDVEYYSALPTKTDLESKLPVDGATSQGLSGVGRRQDELGPTDLGVRSGAYDGTKKASSDFNGLLHFLLDLVETVRKYPPTTRLGDQRIWGPFTDRKTGFQVRVTMDRLDVQDFTYRIQIKRKEDPTWVDALTGNFHASGQLRRGQGTLTVFVGAMHEAGFTAEAPSLTRIEIGYWNDRFPSRVEMTFQFAPGVGGNASLSAIGYTYLENEDLSGSLRFRATSLDPKARVADFTSRWLASGSGRSDLEIVEGTYAGAFARECWDDGFRVTHYFESWPGGRSLGPSSDCPFGP